VELLFIFSICLIHLVKGPFQLVLYLSIKFIYFSYLGFEIYGIERKRHLDN